MNIYRVFALICLGFAVSGCATIVKGTTQSISLSTPPTEGAKCELKSSEGTWYITTPGSVVVHKTKNDIAVTCKKDGFQDASVTIPAKFNAVTFGNIIIGGLVGITVDAASGANFGYAEVTEVPMVPTGDAPTPATAPDAAPPKEEVGPPAV